MPMTTTERLRRAPRRVWLALSICLALPAASAAQRDVAAEGSPASGCAVDTALADFAAGEASALNLTASPGDVRLASTGDQRTDQQATMMGGAHLPISATTWRAQVFTAGVTGELLSAGVFPLWVGPFGSVPNLTLSLRAASGGVPIGPDLVAQTIPPWFGNWVDIPFPSPPTLQAGSEYALILRPATDPPEGTYSWALNSADTYDGGAPAVSTDGGSSWSPPTGDPANDHWDFAFRTLMSPAPPHAYAVEGTLTSSVKDSAVAPGDTVHWGSLSWTATVPAGAALRFQVAASHSAAGPFLFVGPDGTAVTWFANSGASLAQLDGMRYLRYRALLASEDPASTPELHDVSICFETLPAPDGFGVLRGSVVDGVFGGPVALADVDVGPYSATTDASGLFEIDGAAAGTYELTASAAGYASSTVAGVPVLPGSLSPPVVVALAPLGACVSDTLRPAFAAGTKSGVDVDAVPGDVLLARTAALDQSQSSTGRGASFTTDTLQGQTFTPAVSGLLQRVDVYLGCFQCTGPDPDVTVEIRTAGGGAPGDTVLATATIPGYSSPIDQYYTAVFHQPASLVAGTRYAYVLRLRSDRSAGFYLALSSLDTVLDPGSTDQYLGGRSVTAYGGAVWNLNTTDLLFRTYMSAPPSYVAAGTLESSRKDSGAPQWRWSSLSWTADAGASGTVGLQVAASSNPSGPFAFVGPDGTAATFFTSSSAALGPLGYARYLKYKAYLGTGDVEESPALHEVSACYEAPPALLVNGFETGNTSGWGGATP